MRPAATRLDVPKIQTGADWVPSRNSLGINPHRSRYVGHSHRADYDSSARLRKACQVRSERSKNLADGVGFEPTRPLRAYGISSAAPSTELGDPSDQQFCRRAAPGRLARAARASPALQLSSAWSTVRPVHATNSANNGEVA